jgi:hypothetical protein
MPEENENQQGDEFKPITSQEELNKLIGARINQVKSQFSDYDDLKAKAGKYDEVEAASKSELEKAQERIAELEKRSTAAERAALVTRIASEEGVIPEVLNGDTEEEMRAAAKRVLQWRDSNKRSTPPPKKLASGSSAEPATGEKGRAAAALRSLRQG